MQDPVITSDLPAGILLAMALQTSCHPTQQVFVGIMGSIQP